jgi:hypothetical protein
LKSANKPRSGDIEELSPLRGFNVSYASIRGLAPHGYVLPPLRG